MRAPSEAASASARSRLEVFHSRSSACLLGSRRLGLTSRARASSCWRCALAWSASRGGGAAWRGPTRFDAAPGTLVVAEVAPSPWSALEPATGGGWSPAGTRT